MMFWPLCIAHKVQSMHYAKYVGNFVIAIDNVRQRQVDTYCVCMAVTLSYIYILSEWLCEKKHINREASRLDTWSTQPVLKEEAKIWEV